MYFDRYSHYCGNQRAFTECKHEAHGGGGTCRKLCFVKDFPSREECASWLFAWRVSAPDFATADLHIASSPLEDDVFLVHVEQMG